jgi:hypothetical protein
VGQFKEAVQYVQRAAKALYEAARDVFEQVKVAVQRLVELFVEAVTRVLAWVDEHKARLFLMAAAAAGVVALSAALNMWGFVELEKLAYAASLTPFVPAGVEKYSREEVFNILRSAPNPYEEFKKIAKVANAGRVKLAEPWESLRVLIMPRPSEERELMHGRGAELYSKYREDENYRRALFYAVLTLEEAFSVYRSALREYAAGRKEVVQRVEAGEGPFERVMYVADLGLLTQLAKKEETAFENALRILRERLNVEEGEARELAEALDAEFYKFKDVNFGVKALAALIAYREYALGRKSLYGTAAWYWLEVGGSARLLYHAPGTAYFKAKKVKAERPAAVEEMLAETLRRLFLKPGADHYRGLVEELTKGGRLALELEKETKSKKTESYVFRLYRVEEGGGLKELEGVRLKIDKVSDSLIYALEFDARWQRFFKQGLEAAEKAAEELRERWPIEDRLLYMLGWVASDVAIVRNKKGEGVLRMGTSHLWQLAETRALFGWSYVTVRGVGLTLEGPKPQYHTHASLDELDEAIRRSAESGWLKTLGIKAESWEGLKRWVVDHWGVVVEAAARRLGEGVRGELEALRNKLNDDKVAREIVAPALLLIQAERLGVNEETLRYFGAVISGAIDGDGYVSAARKKIGLTSGEREVALLWKAALAAHGIKAEVSSTGRKFDVVASGGDAVKLAGLYFLFGPPLLEGDERIINYKRYEAMKLGAEGLSVSWEGLRRRTEDGPVAADLTISVGGVAVKYNVYLHRGEIMLQFQSTDRSRAELAARLLRHAGVSAEVKKVGGRDEWYVRATTDKLAAGREELRKVLAEIVETARKSVGEEKAKRWLEKLEEGITLMEGWPKFHVGLSGSGGLEVRFSSPNPDSIEQVAQWLEKRGLKRSVHFTMRMPDNGKIGYVRILRGGLAYAAWLSVHGSEDQRKLAAEFVKYILQRAEKAGKKVYEKAKEIIEAAGRGGLR